MKMTLAVLLPCLVLGCCDSPPRKLEPGEIPASDYREGGVQVFNYLRDSVEITVKARSSDGRSQPTLASGALVPAPRSNIDPSLGGDPKACLSLPHPFGNGDWLVTLVDEKRGTSVDASIRPGCGNWIIAAVTERGIVVHYDFGPRRLE